MPLLLCPNCNVSMQNVQRMGIELDMCPTCRGVWLDRGELEKILDNERLRNADYEEAAGPGAQPAQQPPPQAPQPPPQPWSQQPQYDPRQDPRYDPRYRRRDYDDDDDDDRYRHGHRRKRRGFDLFDIFD